MEFGMKRVVASVQAVAILNRIYNGSPVSIAQGIKAVCVLPRADFLEAAQQ